uniref:Uncharacterized protein n=1 Tax=Anguilla anguilla TaxID=7936 RepID=A0A0E9TEY4_ANGAN
MFTLLHDIPSVSLPSSMIKKNKPGRTSFGVGC